MKVTRNLGLRPFHPACGGSRLQRHGFISVIFISAVALSLSVNLSKSVLADAAAEATVEAPRDEVAPSSLPEAASPGSGDGSVKRESADESDSQKIEPSVTPPELGAAEPSAVREKHVTRTKDVSEASPANSGKPREGSQEASERSLREDKPMAEEEKRAERENITGQQSGPHADAARQKRSINDSGTPKLESPLQTGERGEALGQERPAEDEGERQKQSASEEPRAPAPEASGAASETPAGAGSVDSKTDEKQQIVVEEVTQAGGEKSQKAVTMPKSEDTAQAAAAPMKETAGRPKSQAEDEKAEETRKSETEGSERNAESMEGVSEDKKEPEELSRGDGRMGDEREEDVPQESGDKDQADHHEPGHEDDERDEGPKRGDPAAGGAFVRHRGETDPHHDDRGDQGCSSDERECDDRRDEDDDEDSPDDGHDHDDDDPSDSDGDDGDDDDDGDHDDDEDDDSDDDGDHGDGHEDHDHDGRYEHYGPADERDREAELDHDCDDEGDLPWDEHDPDSDDGYEDDSDHDRDDEGHDHRDDAYRDSGEEDDYSLARDGARRPDEDSREATSPGGERREAPRPPEDRASERERGVPDAQTQKREPTLHGARGDDAFRGQSEAEKELASFAESHLGFLPPSLPPDFADGAPREAELLAEFLGGNRTETRGRWWPGLVRHFFRRPPPGTVFDFAERSAPPHYFPAFVAAVPAFSPYASHPEALRAAFYAYIAPSALPSWLLDSRAEDRERETDGFLVSKEEEILVRQRGPLAKREARANLDADSTAAEDSAAGWTEEAEGDAGHANSKRFAHEVQKAARAGTTMSPSVKDEPEGGKEAAFEDVSPSQRRRHPSQPPPRYYYPIPVYPTPVYPVPSPRPPSYPSPSYPPPSYPPPSHYPPSYPPPHHQPLTPVPLPELPPTRAPCPWCPRDPPDEWGWGLEAQEARG